MADAAMPHDYSLVGPSAHYALKHGLANGDWYRAPIPLQACNRPRARAGR